MKADKFTKIVLTVIAVNLSFMTMNDLDLIPKAHASEPAKTMGPTPNINYGLVPLNEDGSINVKLTSHNEIDVNIVGVNTNDELDVNIDEIGGGFLSSGGPVRVKID